MKININIIILLLTIAFSCQERMEKNTILEKKADKENSQEINSNEEQILGKDNFEMPHVEVIEAKFPIRLDLIDFEDKNQIQQISYGKMSGVEEEIKKYYDDEYREGEENLYSMKDIYLNTIQINNSSNLILYWMILKHPSGKVKSKILFFDNTKKEFLEYVHDFNIHALYNEMDRKLEPTNLKERFQIDFPEIDMIDFDGDKFADFKLTRLYHNGTANAIEEMIVEISEAKADTLKFKREWIRN